MKGMEIVAILKHAAVALMIVVAYHTLFNQPKQLVMLDVNKILKGKIDALNINDPDSAIKKINLLKVKMDYDLKEFSKQANVVVLAKGAVIAGCEDITEGYQDGS